MSKSAASSPGAPAAAIQLAESFTRESDDDGRGRQVGERLADRHAARRRRVDHGDRRALADREGLAGVALERRAASSAQSATGTCHGPTIGSRAHRPPTRAVADRDQEGLVRDRRDAAARAARPRRARSRARGTARGCGRTRADVARHARRLAEAAPRAPCRPACCRTAGRARSRRSSSVAMPTTANGQRSRSAERAERLEPAGRDREHVALLRLVRPDLARRHAGLLARRRAQVERARRARPPCASSGSAFDRPPAPTSWIERIGLASPSAQQRSITSCARRCISALPRCTESKSRPRGVGAGAERGRGAAAHPDQHAGPAEVHEQRAGRHVRLLRVRGADVADAAREHDRLVVAAHDAVHLLLVAAEVAGQVGPAELVVERRRPDRPLEHDRERRGDPVRLRLRPFPRPLGAGQAQVRDREADEAGLGLGAAAGRALVADLAARAGRGAREGRDRGRVVVGLDLHQRVRELARVAVAPAHRLGEEALHHGALHDRGVVRVGAHRARRARLLGLADHLEQRAAAVGWPSTTKRALKILWRQCSEFACANIVSSTSVGLRLARPRPRRAGSRSRPARAPGPARRSPPRSPRGPGRARRSRRAGGGPRGGRARPPLRAPPARSRSSGRGEAAARARAGPSPAGGRRCRARPGARSRDRTAGRCRWPWRTRARPSRGAAPRAPSRPASNAAGGGSGP